MKQRIVITRRIFPDIVDALSQRFEVSGNDADELLDREQLGDRLQRADGALTTLTERIDAELLDRCPRLKAVCNIAVGYDNIDLTACVERGIVVTNTPGVLDETTADFAFALLLASARRVSEAEAWLREGRWQRWQLEQFLGVDVHGATLGIVGMGRIGQAVARRAAGFGMRIVYHNRQRLDAAIEARLGAKHCDKGALLETADFIVLLVPYSPATHHLIGAHELARMKKSAILINVARGGVVDDRALIDALENGTIAAAGLDVFEGEPNLRPEFLQLRNVVLTPHIGSSSANTRRRMAQTAADNLIAVLSGQPPPNPVSPIPGAQLPRS